MRANWKNLGMNTDRLELPNGYLYRYKSQTGIAMCFVPAPTRSEQLLFEHKQQEQETKQ